MTTQPLPTRSLFEKSCPDILAKSENSETKAEKFCNCLWTLSFESFDLFLVTLHGTIFFLPMRYTKLENPQIKGLIMANIRRAANTSKLLELNMKALRGLCNIFWFLYKNYKFLFNQSEYTKMPECNFHPQTFKPAARPFKSDCTFLALKFQFLGLRKSKQLYNVIKFLQNLRTYGFIISIFRFNKKY